MLALQNDPINFDVVVDYISFYLFTCYHSFQIIIVFINPSGFDVGPVRKRKQK